jgi:diguanylate cyclase (GGDEF)-like protein
MDLVSRLGGDEFAILLPETGPAAAQKVLPRLHACLQREMTSAKWPVTFSIGVVTCTAAPADMDHLVHLADQLMYAAKRRGKDCIEYALYSGEAGEQQSPERVSAAQ